MLRSLDLRVRIVAAKNSGKYTAMQVARLFDVSRSTVERLCRQERDTGNVEIKKPCLHPNAVRKNLLVHETVAALVEERNDAKLSEYCDDLEKRCGVRISIHEMCKLLKRLDFRRKKNRSRLRTRYASGATSA
jgi:transposase